VRLLAHKSKVGPRVKTKRTESILGGEKLSRSTRNVEPVKQAGGVNQMRVGEAGKKRESKEDQQTIAAFSGQESLQNYRHTPAEGGGEGKEELTGKKEGTLLPEKRKNQPEGDMNPPAARNQKR